MATPFKQRSSGPFKMMGSSPAKQVNISLGMGAEANTNLANEVNVKQGNFNKTGGKSTTPGYSSTKTAKDAKLKKNFDAFQSQKQKGKEFVKNQKIKKPYAKATSKSLKTLTKVKKPVVKAFTKIAKTGLRIGKGIKNLTVPGLLGEGALQAAKWMGKSWNKAENINMNDPKYAKYAEWKYGTSGKSKNKGKSKQVTKGDKIKAIAPRD